MDSNMTRLLAVMSLFRLRPVDLTATGYSKGYISKLLSGKIRAADEFYQRLNSRLIEMIASNGAGANVFDVKPFPIEKIQPLLSEIKQIGFFRKCF